MKQFLHGVSGYKSHGCRCSICRAEMAALSHAQYLERKAAQPQVQTLTSWWTEAPRHGFTKHVESTHLERMHQSNLGKGRNRAISSEELNR